MHPLAKTIWNSNQSNKNNSFTPSICTIRVQSQNQIPITPSIRRQYVVIQFTVALCILKHIDATSWWFHVEIFTIVMVQSQRINIFFLFKRRKRAHLILEFVFLVWKCVTHVLTHTFQYALDTKDNEKEWTREKKTSTACSFIVFFEFFSGASLEMQRSILIAVVGGKFVYSLVFSFRCRLPILKIECACGMHTCMNVCVIVEWSVQMARTHGVTHPVLWMHLWYPSLTAELYFCVFNYVFISN